MKIIQVYKNSLAKSIGLRPGDEIVSINSHPIRDSLDFQFWIAEPAVNLVIMRQGRPLAFDLAVEPGQNIGLRVEPFEYRRCGNGCLFCFVDQNPKGLRSSLYFKDEDYRLSFLYGNYVTLTRVTRSELQRIVEQRLSPLYISVHAIDPAIRQKLLGLRRDDRLVKKIEFLAENRIEMHSQIVLCPGINDGICLEQTVDALAKYFPVMKTVAIVPVGLTKHRLSLHRLDKVTPSMAKKLIAWCHARAAQFKKKNGSRFVFLADEFYLMADRTVPASAYYEDYHQIENGVGMTRNMLDTFSAEKIFFKSIPATTVDIITAPLIAPVLVNKVMPALDRIKGLQARLRIIRNDFFGPDVTVTGLLVAQDIAAQLRDIRLGDYVILPPNCVNDDGLFLDDWTVNDLQKKLNIRVMQPQSFLDIFRKIV